jgi:hypothetical protein
MLTQVYGAQVWRCPQSPALWQQLFPDFHTLPAPYQAARHYHLVLHASRPPMELLQQLRKAAHARGGEAPVACQSFSVHGTKCAREQPVGLTA